MVSLVVAAALMLVAVAWRVRSLCHRGALVEETAYFLLCMAAAAFWAHQYFAFAALDFAEQNAVLGVQRAPGPLVSASGFYRQALPGVPLLPWLAVLGLCEALARLLACGRSGEAARVLASAQVAWWPATRALCARLVWLVGPALLLYLFLAAVLGHDRHQSYFAYSHAAVNVSRPLMPLLTAYCWPALQLHPYWAPGPGAAGPWWDGAMWWGADPRGGNIFPTGLGGFFAAAMPWAVAAVLWTWLHRARRAHLPG